MSDEQFCVEAIAIEPRVYQDGIWIPDTTAHVSILWTAYNEHLQQPIGDGNGLLSINFNFILL